MPNRLKSIGLVLAGIAVGVGLTGPMAQAAENWLKATPSSQTFYVDGHKVALEAYEIGGYNYVKLRDIGKAVDFNVSWDPMTNAALIVTTEPYSDESAPAPQVDVVEDYSPQVDPSIFTPVLTCEVYNGIRDSIVHREDILAGDYEPIPLVGVASPDSLTSLSVAIGMWPSYRFKWNDNGEVVCQPRYAPAFQGAAEHCRPFIDSLAGLSDREKVRQMDFYVCDRMTYALQTASLADILSQDGVVPSYCANYAYCFKFLCDMADIPCILVHSDTHMWNEVYVEGQWWSVDVTSDDGGDDLKIREHLKILHTTEDAQGKIFHDAIPDITVFAKELLAPTCFIGNKAIQ